MEAHALPELAELLLSTASVEEFLADLAQLAAQSMTAPVSCGITFQRDHASLTVASSDHLAAAVDEVQYGQNDGPCLEAMRTGVMVSVPDVASEHRWGSYPAHAAAHGVGSSLSLPLAAAGRNVGAMNLFSIRPHAFDQPADVAHALQLVGRADSVLGVALRQADQAVLTQQLRDALTSRSVIDQALGVLMGQQRCTSVEAFALLRAASSHRNRKLRDVAADVIVDISGHPSVPGPFDLRHPAPPG